MRQRLGLRLLAVMLLATFMLGSAACMGPQRRGGEPQEEKADKEGGEKGKEKDKEEGGDKEKEEDGGGGGGEKEKSDKEEK